MTSAGIFFSSSPLAILCDHLVHPSSIISLLFLRKRRRFFLFHFKFCGEREGGKIPKDLFLLYTNSEKVLFSPASIKDIEKPLCTIRCLPRKLVKPRLCPQQKSPKTEKATIFFLSSSSSSSRRVCPIQEISFYGPERGGDVDTFGLTFNRGFGHQGVRPPHQKMHEFVSRPPMYMRPNGGSLHTCGTNKMLLPEYTYIPRIAAGIN